MTAKLLIEEGDLKGLSLSFENGEVWTVGRDPDECQLVIEDPLASRKHFIARRTPQGIVVENLSETNPLIVNDEEIGRRSHLLQNGDTLKIGNEVLRFYEESSAQVLDGIFDVLKEVTDSDREDLIELDEMDSPLYPDTHPTLKNDNIMNNQEKSSLNNRNQKRESDKKNNQSTDGKDVSDNQQMLMMADDGHVRAPAPSQAHQIDDEHLHQYTLFGEENEEGGALAEIDFGVIETGRWLLKVIGGPNSGAEFYMRTGTGYLIGTDPLTCDIVFHDTSVSRQHARLTIGADDAIFIEDLKSRNGVLINGDLIKERQILTPSTIVTVGTTSFVVYDREGEMQTIISPLLPSIVKVLQQESQIDAPPSPADLVIAQMPSKEEKEETLSSASKIDVVEPPPSSTPIGSYFVLCTIVGLFALAGIGTSLLFQEKPVVMQTQENANELIQEALSSFPSIRWTFNKSNGSLLLLGHVPTSAEKNRLFYNLANLKFIKNLDDNGIIIDEGVLNEVNSLIAHNPDWRGIRVYSSEAGQFILSGTLKSRRQAEQLSSYLSINFPYLDLLKKQIIVEEEIVIQIQDWLHDAQLSDIAVKMNNGEVTLTGSFPEVKTSHLSEILAKIKQIPGVRLIVNQTQPQTSETGIINLSDRYQINGKSRLDDKFTVVINGRILSQGDDLDGMTITKISSNTILLKKDKDKFRIDY